MKFEQLNIGGYDAIIAHPDEFTNNYSVYSSKPGGAIISHEDKEVAKQKWVKGMKLADAVSKVLKLKK